MQSSDAIKLLPRSYVIDLGISSNNVVTWHYCGWCAWRSLLGSLHGRPYCPRCPSPYPPKIGCWWNNCSFSAFVAPRYDMVLYCTTYGRGTRADPLFTVGCFLMLMQHQVMLRWFWY